MLKTNSLSSEKTDRIRVFIFSVILGSVCFLLIYGPYVLNPFYDDWIFLSDERDMIQHYLGFCMYRSSPWQFPLGLVTTASYPHDMSVIYTDAIPLFAFIFKLLDPVLPKIFQYLGIYGMLSVALTGGLGALIIYEHTKQVTVSVLSSPFYSLSWILLYRMFYHTSLTSHWLILLAFYLWMRLDPERKPLKNCLIYAAFSCVALLIHPYLWIMCAGIIAMALLEYLIKTKKWRRVVLYGAVFCGTAFFCLYVFGAFTGGVGANLGAGSYEANLNTFFNSMGYGLLPELPVALLQYEGFGYLGVGGLILVLAAAVTAILKRTKPEMNLHRWMLIITALCFVVISIIPEISFGEHILIKINLGKVFGTLVGIIRSNGRFIWPVCYMILTSVIVFLVRKLDGKLMLELLILCLVIQAVDMIPLIKERHQRYSVADYDYKGLLDGMEELDAVISRYDHIVMDLQDGEVDQYLTYYAYLNGMTTNYFYYARPVDNKVQNTLEALRNDMKNGRYDETLLYVLGEDEVAKYREFDLNFYEVEGRYLASHIPIEGLATDREQ